ncbi:MAG: iron-sulfur cluster assembly scaffold protein [Pseudomonadota bacterium]
MSDTGEMIKLYSEKLLSLAGNMPLTDPLENPQGSAFKRSPLCGSNVSVALNLKDGIIGAFHMDVKACTLGQSAASIFAKHAVGLDYETVARGRDQLFAMLTQDGPTPDAPFEDLKYLEPARSYTNRHASIMLIFEATLDAMKEAARA